MTIKQQGGIFGRNPTFNNVEIDGDLTVEGSTTKNGDEVINGRLDISGTNPFLYLMETDLTDDNTFIRQAGGNFQIGQVSDDKGTRKTRLWIDQSSGDIKFYNVAGDTAQLTYDSTTGNLQMADGAGIDFSATSGTGTSELFDDYEEGTWTVELYDAASGGNVSPTTATGYYTKIGRQVNITFSLSNIDTTGMTSGNQLYFTLPFTSGFVGAGSLVLENFALSSGRTWVAPWVNASDARGRFRQSGDAVVAASLTVGSITSGSSDIERCTLTYFVG